MLKCSKGLESHFVLLLLFLTTKKKNPGCDGDSFWAWSAANSQCGREPKHLGGISCGTGSKIHRHRQLWLPAEDQSDLKRLRNNYQPPPPHPPTTWTSRCCVRLIVPQDALIVPNMQVSISRCTCLGLSSCDRTLRILAVFWSFVSFFFFFLSPPPLRANVYKGVGLSKLSTGTRNTNTNTKHQEWECPIHTFHKRAAFLEGKNKKWRYSDIAHRQLKFPATDI